MSLLHAAIRKAAISEEGFILFLKRINENPRQDNLDEKEEQTQLTPLQLAIFYGGRYSLIMAVHLLVRGANPNIRREDTLPLIAQALEIRKLNNIFSLLLIAVDTRQEVFDTYKNDVNFNPDIR